MENLTPSVQRYHVTLDEDGAVVGMLADPSEDHSKDEPRVGIAALPSQTLLAVDLPRSAAQLDGHDLMRLLERIDLLNAARSGKAVPTIEFYDPAT
jgi:hypothetical protein